MAVDMAKGGVPRNGNGTDPTESRLDLALKHLRSLSTGDLGALEAVGIGLPAIPPLRDLLFQREPSGLFQPRCQAVFALAALGAHDVLKEFLNIDNDISDPVERAGEDAVINAVARAVARCCCEPVFRRLLHLASTRKLTGPIEAIGATRRPEVLPCLIAALEDDLARPVAEIALRNFGRDASTALTGGACAVSPRDGDESDSSRRRRRSALRLLSEIGNPMGTDDAMRSGWRSDPDTQIGLLGCCLALDLGDEAERRSAVQQLVRMLGEVRRNFRSDIVEALVRHAPYSWPLIEEISSAATPGHEDEFASTETQRYLRQLKRRLR